MVSGTTRGRVAAGIAVASALVCVTYFALIAPHAGAAAAAPWQPSRFYAWSAQDVRGIASALPARLGFLVLAFGPLLFAPLFSPAILLAVAPLGEVLLSRMPTTFTMGTHYAGAWIGYVLFAFAIALRRISRDRLRIVLGACIALCVVEFLVADPLHPGLNLRRVEARDLALDHFLTTLPEGAGVATQEEAYTHLALTDPNARLLPELPACRLAHVSCCSIVISPIPRACKSTAARSRGWLTSGVICWSRAAVASSCIAAPAAVLRWRGGARARRRRALASLHRRARYDAPSPMAPSARPTRHKDASEERPRQPACRSSLRRAPLPNREQRAQRRRRLILSRMGDRRNS